MNEELKSKFEDMQFYTDGKRHLVCLPYTTENLHKMADQLGIHRCWFHKDHYDIPKLRIAEIESKCIMVRSRDIVLIKHGIVPTPPNQ